MDSQAMVYTLSLYLRESLAVLLQDRKERIQAAADEVARVEDEVSPPRAGPPDRGRRSQSGQQAPR